MLMKMSVGPRATALVVPNFRGRLLDRRTDARRVISPHLRSTPFSLDQYTRKGAGSSDYVIPQFCTCEGRMLVATDTPSLPTVNLRCS